MNIVPLTRINAIAQVETALKTLAAYGYNVTSVWAEHNAWLASLDVRAVTDHDRTWATQLPEPANVADHMAGGTFEVLTAARAHVGRQYTLSPGQREVLRDAYGLTPTETITLIDVELFPSEDVIWSLTLKSNEHIDPKRKHVLREVVLQPAAAFFESAALKDKAREEDRAERNADADGKPRVNRRKSIADFYVT
jgi:hypothetical protein